MAIVRVTTTHGAVPPGERARLTADLATLTYEAEGFAGSTVAPTVCWTFFDEQPAHAFATGVGEPSAALYYVTVTALAGALDKAVKRKLGGDITSALLALDGTSPTPDDRGRVWVRFAEIANGDLIVGGEATSLASLKALVAQAR